MDQKQILKQMIDLHKTYFDNSFNAMVVLQEQTETMINSFMSQSSWLPEEGKNVLDEWVNAYKKGRDDFKAAVDENFKKVEGYFSDAGKSKK